MYVVLASFVQHIFSPYIVFIGVTACEDHCQYAPEESRGRTSGAEGGGGESKSRGDGVEERQESL